VTVLLLWTSRVLAGGAALTAVLWATGALAYDLPWPSVRLPAACGFFLGTLFFVGRAAGFWSAILRATAGFAGVLAWWLTLQPSNERPWQPDVDRTAWGQIDGDSVTLHNVRRCDYRSETDYTAHWETRVVRLSQVTGIDLAINYWGSPWMAHPIISFQFADAPPLCFSIETRKELGEKYSAIGGLYRQYELVYVVAEESDVLGVRTRHRQGEDVYLYRTTATPEAARAVLLEYLESLNRLHKTPRWYHALTTNCTTSIRTQRAPDKRAPWDWRLLVNGKGDELAYERGTLDRSLPFPELKRRSLINERARAAREDAAFSDAIRQAWVRDKG
jgi:hypothetical protein